MIMLRITELRILTHIFGTASHNTHADFLKNATQNICLSSSSAVEIPNHENKIPPQVLFAVEIDC